MTITIPLEVAWFVIGFCVATALWIGLAVWMYKRSQKEEKNG